MKKKERERARQKAMDMFADGMTTEQISRAMNTTEKIVSDLLRLDRHALCDRRGKSSRERSEIGITEYGETWYDR